jgi:hypothetical protein
MLASGDACEGYGSQNRLPSTPLSAITVLPT